MTPSKPEPRAAGGGKGRRDLAFHQGMLAALAVVADFDAGTIYRHIVDSAGVDNLIAACEGPEDWKWSGLLRYRYVTRTGRKGRSPIA